MSGTNVTTILSQYNPYCWLTRTDKMDKLLSARDIRYSQSSGRQLLKFLLDKYYMFWLSEIKTSKVDKGGLEHNKQAALRPSFAWNLM